MINNYNEYIDKIEKLRSEIDLTAKKYAEKVMKDLDEEFSKYLRKEDFERIVGYELPKIYGDGVANSKIYMLDNTYGIQFNIAIRNAQVYCLIHTWHPINNVEGRKFISNNNSTTYYPEQKNYKKFVKDYIERMKKNIIERDFRKVKRDAKKYNL